jgi:hypothetical protein
LPLITADKAYATKWEILLYGVPGIGKTTLFADCPNVLFIEVDDNGHTVLQKHPKADAINIFHTRRWSELAAFANALPTSQLIKGIDTIVVDTISECQVLERLKQIGGSPLTEDKWKFNQSIYSQNNFKVMALVRAIKGCGKSIAWLCHESTELTDTGEKLVRPAVSATLLSTIQANIDGQFYYKRQGANRVLETDGAGMIQTKSRFARARPFVNPTWKELEPFLTSRMDPNK